MSQVYPLGAAVLLFVLCVAQSCAQHPALAATSSEASR